MSGDADSPSLRRLPQFQRGAVDRVLHRLEAHPNGVIARWPDVMRVLMNAFTADTWTDEDEACLTGLRQEAERYRLFEPDATPPPPLKLYARAGTAMLLALGSASRIEARSDSPWPEERPGSAEIAGAVTDSETALALAAKAEGVDRDMARMAGLLHVHCVMLLMRVGWVSGKTPDLLARISAHADQIPRWLTMVAPGVSAMKTMAKLYTGQLTPSDEAVLAVANENRNLWDSMGADYARAEAAADRADASGKAADIRAAITELGMVLIGLPTGSPVRGRTLTLLAEMQLALAANTEDLTGLVDVIAVSITAIRTVPVPYVAQAAACILTDCLAMMAVIGHFEGPFAEASQEVRLGLARLNSAGPAERAGLLAADAAAVGMRAAALDDESLRRASRQLAAEAERLLPVAVPSAKLRRAEWLLYHRTAQSLQRWTTVQVLSRHDQEMLPISLRVVAKVERCLADGAGTADERKILRRTKNALLAAERRIRRGKSPVPDWAGSRADALAERSATLRGQFPEPLANLRQALAKQLSDPCTHSAAHRALATGLADLYWADPGGTGDQVLRDAIAHLIQSLASSGCTLPSTERADLLDLLARCYHELGRRNDDARTRHQAERAARAALRELAGYVLITQNQRDALAVAPRAGQIAARATAWCLADGRHRAAADLAESGRALLLASVVMTGRAEELLRAAGHEKAADAWLNGADEADLAIALDTLWDAEGGPGLLAVPTVSEVGASIIGTSLDAVVYLVPPDPVARRAAGHALLVRPATGEVEVVALPRLTSLEETPLADYLSALERAVAPSGVGASSDSGFRGTSEGAVWAAALDALGQWAYDTIMEPLLAHASRWQLDGLPHLALIPLGPLAAVPFAAAWTSTAPGGARRYAIEDVVLSYAASARLLGAVASRRRQRLDERVVFVADPTGQFDFSRGIMRGLASRLYPAAKVYGVNGAPGGPATSAVVLDALPGSDRQGASLLHLTTHGTLGVPSDERLPAEPAVQTRDGWLPLARVLDQARGRSPDAPGGLVITSACLTDTSLTGHDESLTLATAFLAAGATAVIGTRWPVDDDTAAALAIRLHHHLKDGDSPAEALRHAQLELLRPDSVLRGSLGPHFTEVDDARLSHPASWAGHVQHGI
jgi:hypothetical protein